MGPYIFYPDEPPFIKNSEKSVLDLVSVVAICAPNSHQRDLNPTTEISPTTQGPNHNMPQIIHTKISHGCGSVTYPQ